MVLSQVVHEITLEMLYKPPKVLTGAEEGPLLEQFTHQLEDQSEASCPPHRDLPISLQHGSSPLCKISHDKSPSPGRIRKKRQVFGGKS